MSSPSKPPAINRNSITFQHGPAGLLNNSSPRVGILHPAPLTPLHCRLDLASPSPRAGSDPAGVGQVMLESSVRQGLLWPWDHLAWWLWDGGHSREEGVPTYPLPYLLCPQRVSLAPQIGPMVVAKRHRSSVAPENTVSGDISTPWEGIECVGYPSARM